MYIARERGCANLHEQRTITPPWDRTCMVDLGALALHSPFSKNISAPLCKQRTIAPLCRNAPPWDRTCTVASAMAIWARFLCASVSPFQTHPQTKNFAPHVRTNDYAPLYEQRIIAPPCRVAPPWGRTCMVASAMAIAARFLWLSLSPDPNAIRGPSAPMSSATCIRNALTDSGLVGSTDFSSARAEDAQGPPTTSQISPSILVYED